jgi:hypothetical protein
VYGFGKRKTNNAFIAACDKFTYFDVLNLPREEPDNSPPSLTSHPAQALTPAHVLAPATAQAKRPLDESGHARLIMAIKNVSDSDNWANLADVGNYLKKLSPDFDARNYGYDKLRELVEASGIADVKRRDMGNKPPVFMVHLRDSIIRR